MQTVIRYPIRSTTSKQRTNIYQITLSKPLQTLTIQITLVKLKSKPSYTITTTSPQPLTSDLHISIIKELSQHKKPKSFTRFLVPPTLQKLTRLWYLATKQYFQSHVTHVNLSFDPPQMNCRSSDDGRTKPGHPGTKHASSHSPADTFPSK